MNNDIRGPQPRPLPRPVTPARPITPLERPVAVSQPEAGKPSDESALPLQAPQIAPEAPKNGMPIKKRGFSWKKLAISLGILAAIVGIAAVCSYIWYQSALQPVSSDPASARVRVTIKPATSPDQIATILHDNKLIRSTVAFDIYTRLSGTKNVLQAGTFSLSPNESTEQIVGHLVAGKVDEFTVTFLPGATIMDNKKVLINAGYSEADVDAALVKQYDHEVFAGKPAGTNLEGYIYGETYNFSTSATPEDILLRTFDELNKEVKANNLVEKFKEQGLTLYEGITMASIIQRETSSPDPSTPSTDQKQVAQVFYLRLNQGMVLGSDVTAYYGADQIGVDRSVAVDTPYNTRIHAGLPPGPIASPSIGALLAAAQPAAGDYVYFLSGDDDVTYFARTNDKHEQNIVDHCKIKCSIP